MGDHQVVSEDLMRNTQALNLWVYLRDHPEATLQSAADELKITRRWASELEKWLIRRGFLIEVRYGDGDRIITQRQVAIPGQPTSLPFSTA